MATITFKEVRESEEIQTYIRRADLSLERMGYTEHSFPHVSKASKTAGDLLYELGYPTHVVDLTRIAGYMHDIGSTTPWCRTTSPSARRAGISPCVSPSTLTH